MLHRSAAIRLTAAVWIKLPSGQSVLIYLRSFLSEMFLLLDKPIYQMPDRLEKNELPSNFFSILYRITKISYHELFGTPAQH